MKVIVIGTGIGGLCAAIGLAARGCNVESWEAAPAAGGKAGTTLIDGLAVDTGPSLLTLPEAFDAALARAGVKLTDLVRLVRPDPAFLYRWPDGVALPVYSEAHRTLESVERVLGSNARAELARFLAHVAQTWSLAAPNFIYAPGVALTDLFSPRIVASLAALEPFRTMDAAICRRVKEPHLRDLLRRYATYNGSHPGRAPATLNCIAHVELTLGGFGVEGGIHRLVEALVGLARERGVHFEFGRPATRVLVQRGRVIGVEASGLTVAADAVVCNADVAHLTGTLLPEARAQLPDPGQPSLSGWTGIFRATGKVEAAHTVLFPRDYSEEFVDLFDGRTPPHDPAVYASAPALAHAAPRWEDAQPLFTMVNAPAGWTGDAAPLAALVRARLGAAGLLGADDPLRWSRTPAELARSFPGSQGAIYGGSSNDMMAAFQRPPNRVPGIRGLYLAGGSAHPGGGMPLCALSGRSAVAACLADAGAA